MSIEERYQNLVSFLIKNPQPRQTELIYNTPFQLLIAIVLSAQCTDQRVNMCTPALFKAFPTAQKLSQASFDQVFPYVKSISYPNNKTKFILETAKKLTHDFNGIIPSSEKQLRTLPGVGRKTANLVLSILYNQPKIAVDTHVFRVSRRIGLVPPQAKTPLMVEKTLMHYLDKNYVQIANQWLILHGRYVCTARKPQCHKCPIINFCTSASKQK